MNKNKIWLRYGIDVENKLVAIDDVGSGKTNLICPYCSTTLIAKKGKIKEHHFAHDGETCNLVIKREPRDIPHLPLYDAFNIFLTGKQLELLKKLWLRHKAHDNGIDRLEILPAFLKKNLIERSPQINQATERNTYQFTNLGLIPVGALPLNLFNWLQEPLILQKLAHLESVIFDNSGLVLPDEELLIRLTDLRIYCAQMRKILLSHLYYLKINANGKTLYKIGITTRPMCKRVAEIYRDLRSHFQSVSVKVIGSWAHRGNVEKYFKYRYSEDNYPIGTLTEYFKFSDPQSIERELHQMKGRTLSPTEQYIVDGTQDKFLASLLNEIQTGNILKRDRLEKDLKQRFFSLSWSKQVIAALNQGCSLQDAAAIAEVPLCTARKLLAVLSTYG